jgi:hypothetical protein
LASDDVRAAWREPSGTLWVGTGGGLNRFDSRPWIKLSVPEGGMEGWAAADQFDVRIAPFDSQYFNYLWDLVRLDLGKSLAPTRGRPVIDDLKLKFPATLELAIASLVITVLIGVPTGAYAAHKRRSVADYGFRIFSIVIWAVPVFWLGIMFQLVLGIYLDEWYTTSTIGQRVLQPIFGDFLPLPISGRIGTELAPRTITGLYLVDSLLTANWQALRSTIDSLSRPAFFDPGPLPVRRLYPPDPLEHARYVERRLYHCGPGTGDCGARGRLQPRSQERLYSHSDHDGPAVCRPPGRGSFDRDDLFLARHGALYVGTHRLSRF